MKTEEEVEVILREKFPKKKDQSFIQYEIDLQIMLGAVRRMLYEDTKR
jgi:hypothetical protein